MRQTTLAESSLAKNKETARKGLFLNHMKQIDSMERIAQGDQTALSAAPRQHWFNPSGPAMEGITLKFPNLSNLECVPG